jgi:hypothetical protein
LGLRFQWHRSALDLPDGDHAAQVLDRYRAQVRAAWQHVFGDATNQD